MNSEKKIADVKKKSGLGWKLNAEEILERSRLFLNRKMMDGILATLPVKIDSEKEWRAFEKRWSQYSSSDKRPFPSNEEIFERNIIGLQARGQVEDDWLPVVYSVLDCGDGMLSGIFGGDICYFHRKRQPAYSGVSVPILKDYGNLPALPDGMSGFWTNRFLDIQRYFESHMDDHFAQHPSLTMDALNFACELRGPTSAYTDLYEHPDELKALMEIALDFNIRFQEAQMAMTGTYSDGSFNWLSHWAPFPRSICLSVDAYVVCSVQSYVDFGFDYQARLIEHFGHGLMHFHCNRPDLAAEVAKLPNLELFQFGGDTRDKVSSMDRLPEMRQVVGDIPIMVACDLHEFQVRLADRTLMPNVWYVVGANEPLTVDDANRLMDKVRTYKM